MLFPIFIVSVTARAMLSFFRRFTLFFWLTALVAESAALIAALVVTTDMETKTQIVAAALRRFPMTTERGGRHEGGAVGSPLMSTAKRRRSVSLTLIDAV